MNIYKRLMLIMSILLLQCSAQAQTSSISKDNIYAGIGIASLKADVSGFDQYMSPSYILGYEKRLLFLGNKESKHVLLFNAEFTINSFYLNHRFNKGVLSKVAPNEQIVRIKTSELSFVPKYGYYTNIGNVASLISFGPAFSYVLNVRQNYYTNAKISENVNDYSKLQIGIDASITIENTSNKRLISSFRGFTLGTRLGLTNYATNSKGFAAHSIYLKCMLLSRNKTIDNKNTLNNH